MLIKPIYMNYLKLKKIKKMYFGYEEISRILGISLESARVFANRYVKNGVLIRIKRNLYILSERWNTLGKEEKFILANLAQVPSYISLMTALEYYGITTQVQRDFFESVAIKQTKEIAVQEAVFNYTKVRMNLYFGFVKEKDFFISTPEKAFLDALYLMSFNKYHFDLTSIDHRLLKISELKIMAKKFPLRTQRILEANDYFRKP